MKIFDVYIPLEYECKWSNGESSKGMAVHDKDVMTHAIVEGELGDDVHSCIAKLQGDHGDIGPGPLKEITAAIASGHDTHGYLTRTLRKAGEGRRGTQ